MTEHAIDQQTFDELTQTVGADFVSELVDTFLEEVPPMLAELRAALEARATESFRRAAHSLKTNANTFGALGGRRAHGTVMFCDIRGFTAIVESQPPEETIELLNVYYTLMFEAIAAQGGVVNQMIGDGLMAIFGAPLPLPEPALAAVRAALDMIEMIELLNAERAAQAKPPIAIGIGIATGEMIAGYTGTQTRATYTCIGDTVNVAARLEAHTKVVARRVLIDGGTRTALAARLPTSPLGPVVFKGKALPVEVFVVDSADRPLGRLN